MSNTESVQPKEEEKEEVAPEVNEKEKSNMKITIIPTVIVNRNIDTKESKDSESIEKETPQGPEKKNEIENKVKEENLKEMNTEKKDEIKIDFSEKNEKEENKMEITEEKKDE